MRPQKVRAQTVIYRIPDDVCLLKKDSFIGIEGSLDQVTNYASRYLFQSFPLRRLL